MQKKANIQVSEVPIGSPSSLIFLPVDSFFYSPALLLGTRSRRHSHGGSSQRHDEVPEEEEQDEDAEFEAAVAASRGYGSYQTAGESSSSAYGSLLKTLEIQILVLISSSQLRTTITRTKGHPPQKPDRSIITSRRPGVR